VNVEHECTTHYACECITRKVADLEAEVERLRKELADLSIRYDLMTKNFIEA